jgi:hypothetical protein
MLRGATLGIAERAHRGQRVFQIEPRHVVAPGVFGEGRRSGEQSACTAKHGLARGKLVAQIRREVAGALLEALAGRVQRLFVHHPPSSEGDG